MIKKKRKSKKVGLKGYIQTGTIFIGDTGYMRGNPQDYASGVVPEDGTNPFKNPEAAIHEVEGDYNLELPGSFNGDLPGRGVVIQTNMFSGKYTVTKRLCKETGKLLEVKVRFHE